MGSKDFWNNASTYASEIKKYLQEMNDEVASIELFKQKLDE